MPEQKNLAVSTVETLDLRADAQERFEKAVDIALRHQPISRIKAKVSRRRSGANKRSAKTAN